MSRYYHTVSNDVDHILHDYRHLPVDEFKMLYGIEIEEDGTVYDPVLNKEFPSIPDWAKEEAEIEEMETGHEYGHGKETHEDYF